MREKELITLCDEDIEMYPDAKEMGEFTDEEFQIVAEEMTEYLEESFQYALEVGINAVMNFRNDNS